MSKGGYPHIYGMAVPDDQWISQEEAARRLGVFRGRVVMLVANDHLIAAKDSQGRPGVTIASVSAELEWRKSASPLAKLKRAFVDIIGYF